MNREWFHSKEAMWLSYIITGLYGAISWFWYARGRRDAIADLLKDPEPCTDCLDNPPGASHVAAPSARED